MAAAYGTVQSIVHALYSINIDLPPLQYSINSPARAVLSESYYRVSLTFRIVHFLRIL